MRSRHVPVAAEPGAWTRAGACRGKPTEWFYMPDDGSEYGNKGRREADLIDGRAKRCCLVCVVKRECLEYAIEHHEDGYWGGTTAAERRLIRVRRAA